MLAFWLGFQSLSLTPHCRSARGIRSFVLSLLNEDTAVDIGCLSSVAVLMPRIEGMAETLKKLARLNNAVHASLYQRLCREAAAELLAVE